MARKLTIKQDKFVREYVKDGNGTRAAKQAGYSPDTAYSIANENLNKPEIAQEVAIHRQRLAERLDISREKLVNDAAHDAEQASVKGDFGAANANRTFIAKAQGYHIERSMHVHVDTSLAHLEALKDLMRAGAQIRYDTERADGQRGARARVVGERSLTDVDDDDA
jgi:hypothetical protein